MTSMLTNCLTANINISTDLTNLVKLPKRGQNETLYVSTISGAMQISQEGWSSSA